MTDTSKLDACVHCGLCLTACPTYDVTGNELDSPRGRIVLARGLAEGRIAELAVAAEHLDLCLGCRACETACPSGVRYGAILEEAREELTRRRPPRRGQRFLLRTLLGTPTGTVVLMRILWIARRLGLVRWAARGRGRAAVAARVAPDPRWRPWSRSTRRIRPASGERRGTVALLPGCVMDQGFAAVHEASARLLGRAGFDVRVPRGPLCCGALLAHAGDARGASARVAKLTRALGGAPIDALVVNAAGCGSHLKDADWSFAERTYDLLEFLDAHEPGFAPVPIAQRFGAPHGERLRVVLQDACHLRHGQRIVETPRRLLARIPDVELVPIAEPDRCCGGAGVYNLLQPEMAQEQLRRKVDAIAAASPHVVASANPGCMLQIAAGLRGLERSIRVEHVATLLAASIPAA